MSQLALRQVHKGFGTQPVLVGVDLEVPEGSITAVLGPSGSGKTTLLRLVAGFERCERGVVSIGDRVVDDGAGEWVAPEHRRIGYVPQEGSLFPNLNVERNVAFGLGRGRRHGPRVQELLEMVGLGGLGRRYPHQLSGGQQQRVALARALAVAPTLVLLDEPFSSLDAALRQSVRDDVVEVLRAAGTTAVLVTHDQDEALSVADQVAVIDGGRVAQVDRPQVVYARPEDPELAAFLGEANLVPGTVEGGSVRTALGLLELDSSGAGLPPDGSGSVVLLRPEQVTLLEDAGAPAVAGRVLTYRYFGHDAVVRVQPAPGSGLDPLLVRVDGHRAWAPGAEVALTARGPVRAWPAPGPGTARHPAPAPDEAPVPAPAP